MSLREENYPQEEVMVSITAETKRKQILSTNSHEFLRIGNNAKLKNELELSSFVVKMSAKLI